MADATDTPTLTILMSGELNEQQIGQIRAAAPAADVRYFKSRADLECEIEQADIVAGSVSPAGLARATNLKWVQSWAGWCISKCQRCGQRAYVSAPTRAECVAVPPLFQLNADEDCEASNAERDTWSAIVR